MPQMFEWMSYFSLKVKVYLWTQIEIWDRTEIFTLAIQY